jgi:hypothetical protein
MTDEQIKDFRERLEALAHTCNEQIVQIRACSSGLVPATDTSDSSRLVFEVVRDELDSLVRELQPNSPALSLLEHIRLDGFPI